MSIDAFQASSRFGLGPTPTELSDIGSDPRSWLIGQIENAFVPTAFQNIEKINFQAQAMGEMMKKKGSGETDTKAREEQKKDARRAAGALFAHQSGTRIITQATSRQPFIERLVMFWSNHFTVSVQRPQVMGLANAFEVEAIRPHVTGKFYDMLLASSQHPAMLAYLDNARSIGPNSPRGLKREKGLNENLAREILELHTLGAQGGYTQADVISFAKIITGWTFSNKGAPQFSFDPGMHEPGNKTLLGKSYAENGVNEGLSALQDIARHPATAQHIATKLARHFISDTPPENAVAQLADTYLKTDGDLGAVSRALVNMKECWANPLEKFKNPYEYYVSALRLTGYSPEPKNAVNFLGSLNFKPFNANAPIGYADTADVWMSPDAIMKRIEFAQILAKRLSAKIVPLDLAQSAFGPVMREETAFVIKGAASGQDGIAFILSAPEFMRR